MELIGSTKTETGLEVHAWLDKQNSPKGKKVSDAELALVNLKLHRFHGEWNYTIHPARRREYGRFLSYCP